ncbi:unnamed protein product [Urochloa decumbens]|uniref:Uncharacterized protein n=1 Tax=Urochloa decumbens TaxID=240449 RepID=A0ABC9H3Z9_9POAL
MGRRPGSGRRSALQVTLVGSSVQEGDSQEHHGNIENDLGDRAVLSRQDKVEVGGVYAKCSFSRLYDVIGRLSERKKELVREIGFGGLLYFPAIRQVDRRFVVWLMCRVDALAQTLVVGDNIRVKFVKEDVERVFGIPCGGKMVGAIGKAKKMAVGKLISDMVGIDYSKCRSIRSLEGIIDREYGDAMSDRDAAVFKIAFVIYVMSTMLSPGCRFDYAGVEYWDCLHDVADIGSYDWCDYVVRKVIDAVVKMKNDLNATGRVPNICGCTLFLQVLYLDSIDLGVLSMEHDVRPRVRCFGPDRMKCMIRADTIRHSGDPKDRVFGKSKLLPASKVCYSWAACLKSSMVVAESTLKESLWEATVRLASLFNMSAEQAAPLFDAVMGIDLSTGLRVTSAVSSFLEPVVRQMTRVHAVMLDGDCQGGLEYGCSGKRFLDWKESELPIKKVRFRGESSSSSTRSDDVKDPWFLGFKFTHGVVDASEYLRDMSSRVRRSRGKGICMPRFVTLVLKFYQGEMLGEVEIDAGVVDGVLRCFKERDSLLYGDCGSVRWRHFVESDFTASVLGGTLDANRLLLSSNFDVDVVCYDPALCKLIFFPLRLGDRWVCYAWSCDDDVMHVFDPLVFIDGWDGIYKFHVSACKVLRHVVSGVVGVGTSAMHRMGVKLVVEPVEIDARLARIHCSGLACLYFCTMFDGHTIRGVSQLDDIVSVGTVMLAEALHVVESGVGYFLMSHNGS